MGCVYGKCCGRFRRSSGDDNKEVLVVYPGQSTHILANRLLEIVNVPSHNFRLEYSVLTQRGHYPETPGKENQDSYCIRTNIQGNPDVHFFGVFDGHGQFGTECSNFVKDRLVDILSNDAALLDDPVKAYSAAFLAANDELHNSDIDDSMSGTTAITVLMIGDKLYVANVGDSRAVLAVKEGNKVLAQDLSCDQTPFRADECQRVKLCGARVLSVDQVEGLKDPGIQSWGDEETEGGDPPRLWVQDEMYPGTAFTRSVGDRLAEKIGVVADPEVSMVQLTAKHPFFVVASDGVFEFLPSQTVVDMVSKYADPRDACSAIAAESYKLWLEHENRTDDITIILVQIKDLTNGNLEVWRVITVFCFRINYTLLYGLIIPIALKRQVQRNQEEKAKEELLAQASSFRNEREQIQDSAKSKENMIKSKAANNLQKYKDDIERLQEEMSQLRLKTDSSKIAAYRWGIDSSYTGKLAKWINSSVPKDSPISYILEAINRNGGVKRERECVMCLSEEMFVVFLPCSPQVVCSMCNELHKNQGMKDSPSCRSPIQRRICVRFALS